MTATDTSKRVTLQESLALDEVAKAIRAIGPQVCDLVAAIDTPGAAAVGVWSGIETAVHLMQTMELDQKAALDAFTPDERAQLSAGDLKTLDQFTQRMVEEEPERDPDVLAARMAKAADAIAAELSVSEADREITWLGGMRLPLSAVGAHVVEESVVHGLDIARSQGRTWRPGGELARIAVADFVVPIMLATDPNQLLDHEAAAGLDATFEVRLRGAGRLFFVFDRGRLTITESWDGPVDVHFTADAGPFLFLMMQRRGPLRSALTGRFVVWGRRPWLMSRFAQLMKGP